jgi:hypothetical protein
MIEWYKDKNLAIYFSDIPQVGIRYILPEFTSEERKSVDKYPFINKQELQVVLVDYQKDKEYKFTVSKGYCYDGASIPRAFWRIIGSNTDNKFLIPALVHDVLCENHQYVNYDRKFSTEVFNALLKVSGVYPLKRFVMKNSVDSFQKIFCNWKIKKGT